MSFTTKPFPGGSPINTTRKSTKVPEGIEEAEQTVEQAMQTLEKRIDLEGSARYSGALRRRRVIQSGRNLLRLVMVYGLTDYSLRMVGLWGTVMGWGSLCKSGVRKRLRQCQGWIGMLIVLVLLSGKLSIPRYRGLRLRLIDATTVRQVGSRKANWRLHLSFDLSSARIDEVLLTSAKEGETLTHWQFQPDEICLADRYYSVPRGVGMLLGAMALFVLRIGWQNLPLQDQEKQPFRVSDWLRVLSCDPAATPAQTQVWVQTPQGRFPIRLIARAIPPEKAERIRQNLRKAAKERKHGLDERSLLAAGFVMVVSNLPESWSASQILDLYRFRWQVELVFKRLKGILAFDHLRATDPVLAQVYLLTKILIALLLEECRWQVALSNPEALQDTQHPVSCWRLTQLLHEMLRQAICGSLTLDLIQKHQGQLRRYLCDDPRRRPSQLAHLPHLGEVYDFYGSAA
jgi:Transposase DDE domain